MTHHRATTTRPSRLGRRGLLAAGLSILLGIGVAISPDGASAVASGCPTASGVAPMQGSGIEGKPCIVLFAEHLDAVRDAPNLHYKQARDIDLARFSPWEPIPNLNGTYDGGFNRISSLTVDKSGESSVGLFREGGSNSLVKRVRLEGVSVLGNSRVGGLFGRTAGDVQNTSVEGVIEAQQELVGGIVGQASGNAKIEQYNAFIGTVEGGLVSNGSSGSVGIGGIVGRTSNNSSVSEAYVRGTVRGNLAGGIVGSTSTVKSELKESYASVKVEESSGPDTQKLGGAVAGRVEALDDEIQDSVYWNKTLFAEAYGEIRSGFRGVTDADGLDEKDMQGISAQESMDNLKWTSTDPEEPPVWQVVAVPEDDFPVFSWQRGSAEIEVTVNVSSKGERTGDVTVTAVSRDAFFQPVEVKIPLDRDSATFNIFPDVHLLISAVGKVNLFIAGDDRTVELVATRAAPSVTGETIDLVLAETSITVGSETKDVTSTDRTVEEEEQPDRRVRTFTAGSDDATLSAVDLADGLAFGDVEIVAQGSITMSSWQALTLSDPRTLTLEALGDVTTTSDDIGLRSDGATLTVDVTSTVGQVNIRSSGPMTLGRVSADGPISVTTALGGLTVTDTLTTADTSDAAIVLGAGVVNQDECSGTLAFTGVEQSTVFDVDEPARVRLFTWTDITGFDQSLAGEKSGFSFAQGLTEPVTDPVTVFVREGAPTIVAEDFGALVGTQPKFTVSLFCFATEQEFDVQMTADSGDLELSTQSDITALAGFEASGESEIGFRGTLANLRSAMSQMTYEPGSVGEIGVNVVVSQAGDVKASTSFTITVASLPDKPEDVLLVPGNRQLVVTFTTPDSSAPILGYQYTTDGRLSSADLPEVGGQFVITETSGGALLDNGQVYTVQIRAVSIVGQSDWSDPETATPAAQVPAAPQRPRPSAQPPAPLPEPSPVVPSLPSRIPSGTTPIPTPSAPLSGPVTVPGVTPQPPRTPTATVGGLATPTQSQVTGGNQLQVTTGSTQFGLTIPQGFGQVSSGDTTELSLSAGGVTSINAAGLLPGSRVQVFMPLAGNDFREVSQLAVDEAGAVTGDVVFATGPTDPPLPIGRHVLQIASVDDTGQRVIVDLAVNIAQGSPTPEVNREDGTLPTLAPGRSLATEAGVPVPVQVVVDATTLTTDIIGDGWRFAVDVSGEGSKVEQTADGDVFLSVIRGTNAEISGEGFEPGSRADVWLFSEPTLLGTLEVNDQGGVNGQVNFDPLVIASGDHTIQIQGVGTDGFIRAASIGVQVTDLDTAQPPATGDSATTTIWWALALLLLVAIVAAVLVWRRRATTV